MLVRWVPGDKTGKYVSTQVKTLTADALFDCVTRPPAVMVLTVHDKRVLDLPREEFQ